MDREADKTRLEKAQHGHDSAADAGVDEVPAVDFLRVVDIVRDPVTRQSGQAPETPTPEIDATVFIRQRGNRPHRGNQRDHYGRGDRPKQPPGLQTHNLGDLEAGRR